MATGTRRGNESRRRPPSSTDQAVRGHLEMQLQDLKRDWDAYKTGRSSSAPRHRPSRSASGGFPSSAVTVDAAPDDDDGFHHSLLRCSPRRLVSSLQHTGSAADAPTGPRDDDEDDASIVCSVEGGYSVSATATHSSSCSCCPRQCAVLCCCGGYSTSSSCTGGTTVAPFSSAVGVVDGGERARKKMGEGMWWPSSRVVWISAAAAVLGVLAFVAMMVILELAVDEGRVEYLVPT